MWRTVLGFSVFLYAIVSHVTTAPAYYHHIRGPRYTINNDVPETRRTLSQKNPIIEVRNETYHGNGPREEARAMCSVKTQEINATANATITRRMYGVVSSKEFHSAISRMELVIHGQMANLWKSLDALRAQLAGEPSKGYPPRDKVTLNFPPRSRRTYNNYYNTGNY